MQGTGPERSEVYPSGMRVLKWRGSHKAGLWSSWSRRLAPELTLQMMDTRMDAMRAAVSESDILAVR